MKTKITLYIYYPELRHFYHILYEVFELTKISVGRTNNILEGTK